MLVSAVAESVLVTACMQAPLTGWLLFFLSSASCVRDALAPPEAATRGVKIQCRCLFVEPSIRVIYRYGHHAASFLTPPEVKVGGVLFSYTCYDSLGVVSLLSP